MENGQSPIYQKLLELERKIVQLEGEKDAAATPQAQQLTIRAEGIQKAQEEQIASFNKLIESLKEAQPSWRKDGGGVRGQQPEQADLPDSSSLPPSQSFSFTQEKEESQKLETEEEATQITETQQVAQQENCIGLNLYTKYINDSIEVWVGSGTVAGQLPLGFDPSDGKFVADDGIGEVWAKIEIDENTGDVLERSIESGAMTPSNTNTSFYYALGHYEYENDSASVTNFDCGSVNVTICRNWFASSPPFYGVTFAR